MPDPQLRFTTTLSGGASLGAYQAGAMAALLVAVRRLLEHDRECVRVDAMGGASAGALVSLFSAYALVEGIDPVRLLHETWVEGVTLDLLRSDDSRAPLSFDELRDRLAQLFGAGGAEPRFAAGGTRQDRPIGLHVALTGLRGLSYPIRGMRRDGHITGVTYADWGRFVLEPGAGADALFEPEGASPLEFALASAANPGGFAPRLLRREQDREQYEARGIDDFPDSGRLWYSDGALVQAQPLGRVVAEARLAEGDDDGRAARRVHLMVDPRSEGPSGSARWTEPEDQPSWLDGLKRALAILPAQILYDDLRRMEKRNSRLDWAERLVDALLPHLDAEALPAVREVLSCIDDDRGELRSDEPRLDDRERRPPAASDEQAELRRALRRAVDEIGGLVGKEPVRIDVISPRLLVDGEDDEDVLTLLAGEFMGDFGGFLSRDLRHSDFLLGYASSRRWLERALPETHFEAETVEQVIDHVEEQAPGDWREANRGRAAMADLSLKDRAALGRFAAHVARVLGAEVVSG